MSVKFTQGILVPLKCLLIQQPETEQMQHVLAMRQNHNRVTRGKTEITNFAHRVSPSPKESLGGLQRANAIQRSNTGDEPVPDHSSRRLPSQWLYRNRGTCLFPPLNTLPPYGWFYGWFCGKNGEIAGGTTAGEKPLKYGNYSRSKNREVVGVALPGRRSRVRDPCPAPASPLPYGRSPACPLHPTSLSWKKQMLRATWSPAFGETCPSLHV